MKRYILMLLPVYEYLRRYYYVSIPVAVCLMLLMIVRPWSTQAEVPASTPKTKSTYTGKQGSKLLVADRAPAGSQVSYEFIMPEDQQKKVIAEAPKLKAGDEVAAVIKKLGTPLKDNANYGKKDAADAAHGRALSYYFGKRSLSGANDFDPLVYIVFDEKGKLFAMTSNVSEVSELNWGAGITAQFGIVH
jgi:hypothetical protein